MNYSLIFSTHETEKFVNEDIIVSITPPSNILKYEYTIIKDSLGYMLCEIVDIIDAETHDLFIGRLIEADKFSDEEEMTYNYYQEHKEELLKVKTEVGNTVFVCSVCGYVYYGEELPEDFKCPVCGVDKKLFNKK